jgi:hypothetical protein
VLLEWQKTKPNRNSIDPLHGVKEAQRQYDEAQAELRDATPAIELKEEGNPTDGTAGPAGAPIYTEWSTQTYQGEVNRATQQEFSYSIMRPTLQLNRIYLPKGVGEAIVQAGKDASPDKNPPKIRIQTHSWKVLTANIFTNQNVFDYYLQGGWASVKAVFFTLTPSTNMQNISRSKTQFIQRGLLDYQWFYCDEPITAAPVRVSYPNTEAYQELMRAWNIAHKTMDAPTLIKVEDYNENMKQNDFGFFQHPSSCVYGIDLESFASKHHLMDSGVSTKGSNTLRVNMNFRPPTERDRREWGDTVVVRFYVLYDMFVAINDGDGSVSAEW